MKAIWKLNSRWRCVNIEQGGMLPPPCTIYHYEDVLEMVSGDTIGWTMANGGRPTMTDKLPDAELAEAVEKQWPGSRFIENVSNDLLNGVNYKVCRAVLEAALKARRENVK